MVPCIWDECNKAAKHGAGPAECQVPSIQAVTVESLIFAVHRDGQKGESTVFSLSSPRSSAGADIRESLWLII